MKKGNKKPEIVIEEISQFNQDMLFDHLSDLKGFVYLDGQMDSRWSRFSVMAFDPFASFVCSQFVQTFSMGGKKDILTGCPFENLDKKIQLYAVEEHLEGMPFLGAAIGFVSYDASMVSLPLKIKQSGFPEMQFGFYDRYVVFDHKAQKSYWVQLGILGKKRPFRGFLEIMCDYKAIENPFDVTKISPSLQKEDFYKSVKKIQKHIKEGDCYQVNFSYGFEAHYQGSLSTCYKMLRQHSPAPFSAFLNFDDITLLSASPERFLKIDGQRIQTRPIKGTIRRGMDAKEDALNQRVLLDSEKDRAELMMIVDLMRHDLGRICELKSVDVVELYELEAYAQVFHLVSTIEGELLADISHSKALKTLFPAGSITGAPKLASAKIIDDLESLPRSAYTGSIGYIGFNGVSDFNVAIRSLYANETSLFYHTGGGIALRVIWGLLWSLPPSIEAFIKRLRLSMSFAKIFTLRFLYRRL
jgi:para-aminobenzoate synthetase component 1